MAQTFAKFAKFFRPICKNSGDIVAVKLHDRSITIAGIDIKSNIIHLENLASTPCQEPLNGSILPASKR